MGFDVPILGVDSRSEDDTGVLARRAGADVVFEPRTGYGRAYNAGFANVMARETSNWSISWPRATFDFKERNEKIAIRRQAGATLLSIAVEFGITKERVRQILSELCGGTECKDFITSNEAGRLLGFSGSSIRRWIGLGVIKCIKSGNRYLIYREDLPLLKESLQERMVKRTTSCEICGRPILPPRRMYCSDRCMWRAKYRRCRSDPDKAKKQDQLIRKWQKEHIVRFREICRRASAKFRLKGQKTL